MKRDVRMSSALVAALAAVALVSGCGRGGEERLTPEARARCGARGAPATIDKIVAVFRANGITADLNERGCEDLAKGPPEVTNAGYDGLHEQSDEARAVEGDVLCGVYPRSYGRTVEIAKYPDDWETIVGVLNVQCRLYPTEEASRQRQVRRLTNALEALVRATPR